MRRQGFTLVELLVVISIIGLLAALLLPAIAKARESSRGAACQSNLRNMYVGLESHSMGNPSGTYCSGGFDALRDGEPTEIGWVADLVRRGILVGEMRCSSNGAVTSRAIEQLLSTPIADMEDNTCVDRLGEAGIQNELGQTIENVARQIVNGKLAPGSPERAEAITKRMLENGYNTNYAATWFMVRSAFRIGDDGTLEAGKPGCSDLDPKGANVTKGPLTTRLVDSGKTPSSTIPLLCDGAPSGILSGDIGSIPGGSIFAMEMVGVPIGARQRIDTNGDGKPDAKNPYYLQVPKFVKKRGVSVSAEGPAGWRKIWNHDTRQDYRGISPHHLGVANVLFADGSVRGLYDANNDGFINNGFDPNDGGPVFWTSSKVEADKLQLASYNSLMTKAE